LFRYNYSHNYNYNLASLACSEATAPFFRGWLKRRKKRAEGIIR
jgi:hypothetical protein